MSERAALVELVTNFKAALKRKGDESESDESIAYTSNRGRKLKRRARFVREGQLDAPTGPRVYKEEVEYGGTRRYIIHRYKRRRRDEDEEEGSDNDSEGTIEEEDPFEGIDIEKILAPVNNPADLPAHPTLSLPYTSRILDQLCQQALDIMVPEHEHTIAIKNLLTTFLGDDEFAALGKLETPEIPEFMKQALEAAKQQKGASNGTMDGKKTNGSTQRGIKSDSLAKSSQDEELPRASDAAKSKDSMELDTEEEEHDENINQPAPTRMTTRSYNSQQQQNVASPVSPILASPRLEIDPFFFPPNYAVDRDFGIPPIEADETRRLLLAAVQRQEEFMRGLNKVYKGLLEAKHKKQNVWRWCRAMEGAREYHAVKTGRGVADIPDDEPLGALSDHEDWYDRDEWKLEQDLIKGKEEEEEEEKTKKTRGRRA